ncbi:MAG: hypothetical protein DESF_02575 [Desulfovibrio sp.]
MQALAREFGISDVGLTKICKRNNIPRPERGYWAKLYSGRKMKKPPLPKSAKRNVVIRINRTEIIYIPSSTPCASREIIIPSVLNSPHPLIEVAKKSMRFSKDEHGYSESPEKIRCLNIQATTKTFDRALLIMDSLIKALEQEGMYVKINERGSTVIVVGEEDVDLYIREPLKKVRVELDPKKDSFLIRLGSTHRTEYVPSGRLRLGLNEYTGARSKWRDTEKRMLESSLGNFISCVRKTAIILQQRRVEWEARKLREREEQQWRYEESRKESDLKEQLAAFTYCETLRNYAQNLRKGIIEASGKEPEAKAAEWIAWIERRASRYDTVTAFVAKHIDCEQLDDDEE